METTEKEAKPWQDVPCSVWQSSLVTGGECGPCWQPLPELSSPVWMCPGSVHIEPQIPASPDPVPQLLQESWFVFPFPIQAGTALVAIPTWKDRGF